MRALHRLSARRIATAPPGKHCDGGGLWLVRRPDGGAQWMLRVTIHGKRREMGLGPFPAVSLAEARALAEQARLRVRAGVDPIQARARQRREAARNLHLLKDVAHDAFEARKADLKGDGLAGRWFSPLERHVLPRLGHIPVAEIDQIAIRDCLTPIWHTKAETARKAINRLGLCLKHAAALGLDVDLQATEKARALLGRSRHVPKHIPAMPWREVPGFYGSLNEGTVTHLALRLLILTGVRSDAIRHIHEAQIDKDVWTVPAEHVKGRIGSTKSFRVPLVNEAMEVLTLARRHARNGFLFPSARKGVISDATMSRLMERRGLEARPHGFRTSLRVWIAEALPDTPHDVAEMCIGHTTGGKVERAYRRTDFLDQRRQVLERWAKFVISDTSREQTT